MSSPARAAPRAIFFDAGNTLIRMDYAAVVKTLAGLGVTVTADDLQRSEWRARVRLDTDLLAPPAGAMSTETRTVADRYLTYVLEGAGVVDPATVAAMSEWRRSYNAPVGLWYALEPSAEPALALARAAGVRTAVISNSNGSARGIMESLGLARYLDFVIDSGEVGVEKPDPRIFRFALERAGVGAADAVYVGDLYSVDVRGARAAGLDAILLDPGACWGERDCRSAPDALAAVRLALGR
jgi:putative hydrolase of the HAD superfamily